MRQFVLSIVFLLLASYSFAAPDYPVRVVDGKSYYEYTVKAGDGLFAIARTFGIKQRDIAAANPGITADIRPGQMLLIPVSDSEKGVRSLLPADKIHVVGAKQTLYGISRTYGLSVDSLLALNPFASRGLRVGDTLLIAPVATPPAAVVAPAAPTAAPQFHVVQRKETLYAISRKYSMPIHEILALNPSVSKRLRAGDTLALDSSYLRGVVAVAEPKTVYPDSTVLAAATDTAPAAPLAEPTAAIPGPVIVAPVTPLPGKALDIVYLLPFHTEQATVHKSTFRFVEFYRGALVALENAKRYGVSATVRTYDTGRTVADIQAVLAKPELAQADIIIGPAYSDQLDAVISFARQNNIATIIPFSQKVPEDLYYPGLFQFNPPCAQMNAQAVDAITADRNRRYVIGRFDNVQPEDRSLADELSASLLADSIDVIDTILNFSTLRYIVDKVADQPTTLLMASSAPADVNLLLDSLAAYQRHNIRVWASEKWTTLVSKYPNTVHFSLFNNRETPAYTALYSKMFGVHTIVSEPRYDLLGYDLTTMATRALTVVNDTVYTVEPLPAGEYMQSAPLFIPYQNRMVNNRITIFHWDGVSVSAADCITLPKNFDDVADEK